MKKKRLLVHGFLVTYNYVFIITNTLAWSCTLTIQMHDLCYNCDITTHDEDSAEAI